MTVKEFDKLSKRDFANGAVLDEIRTELKKAAKWNRVKEIAKCENCSCCQVHDVCESVLCESAKDVVDALDGEEEKEDAS